MDENTAGGLFAILGGMAIVFLGAYYVVFDARSLAKPLALAFAFAALSGLSVLAGSAGLGGLLVVVLEVGIWVGLVVAWLVRRSRRSALAEAAAVGARGALDEQGEER